MSPARKRPRSEPVEESRAECPFSVRTLDPKEKEQKGKKRRKRNVIDEDEGTKKILHQLSPFAPSGKFKTFETMDCHFVVDPPKAWSDMTRYNSFVLNSIKYFSEGFIYVANESTIERQKETSKDQIASRKRSDDDWVARILEIRASDEHHVYARVYWMYWPDELPAGTHDGKKSVQGRQSYHGQNELIASNHMDIINVVSVTSQAQVNQMIEDNDDDIQETLYWRQALDVRTMELSTVDLNCRCGLPANPDKVLIGCPNEACAKWLHDDCLKHDALLKTFERLGRDKPHKSDQLKMEEVKRPLSPIESGAAVSAQHSIDVNPNKEEQDAMIAAQGGSVSPAKVSPATNGIASEEIKPKKAGRGRMKTVAKGVDSSAKPYQGLFEAVLRMDQTPPAMEIRDLRENVIGGEKFWTEEVTCLLCSSRIQ